MPELEPPHTNGAGPPSGVTRVRTFRRRVMIGGLVVVAAAWAIALTYSVTVGGRSPERLDNTSARAVESACREARDDLGSLAAVGERPSLGVRAARLEREDEILTAMVARVRALHPQHVTPASALNGWLDDWKRLITARQHYASDLRAKGDDARFIEPAYKGVDPIADKMNTWILEQGTRTKLCNTDVLQAEIVNGPRTYGSTT